MKTITFDKPIKVPKVWATLLEIENFDNLPTYPNRKNDHVTDNFDPTPYRDDEREEVTFNDEYEVALYLRSGDYNYYLEYEVWVLTDDSEAILSDETFHELPTGKQRINASSMGLEFLFDVEQV